MWVMGSQTGVPQQPQQRCVRCTLTCGRTPVARINSRSVPFGGRGLPPVSVPELRKSLKQLTMIAACCVPSVPVTQGDMAAVRERARNGDLAPANAACDVGDLSWRKGCAGCTQQDGANIAALSHCRKTPTNTASAEKQLPAGVHRRCGRSGVQLCALAAALLFWPGARAMRDMATKTTKTTPEIAKPLLSTTVAGA
jgi:hypothetical protein